MDEEKKQEPTTARPTKAGATKVRSTPKWHQQKPANFGLDIGQRT